jgi:hypothetical protein
MIGSHATRLEEENNTTKGRKAGKRNLHNDIRVSGVRVRQTDRSIVIRQTCQGKLEKKGAQSTQGPEEESSPGQLKI